jgi:hypothetical protein
METRKLYANLGRKGGPKKTLLSGADRYETGLTASRKA